MSVIVSLTASDSGGPGVASTTFKIDAGANETYSGPVVVSGDGTHTITYFSTDTIGDVETARSTTFKIDGTPPMTTSTAVSSQSNAVPNDYAYRRRTDLDLE